jgi:hypothetical protein
VPDDPSGRIGRHSRGSCSTSPTPRFQQPAHRAVAPRVGGDGRLVTQRSTKVVRWIVFLVLLRPFRRIHPIGGATKLDTSVPRVRGGLGGALAKRRPFIHQRLGCGSEGTCIIRPYPAGGSHHRSDGRNRFAWLPSPSAKHAAASVDCSIDDIGILSRQRDCLSSGISAQNVHDLIALLNESNELWVRASRRMSARLLSDLLVFTGAQVSAHFASLDPAHPRRRWQAWPKDPRFFAPILDTFVRHGSPTPASL